MQILSRQVTDIEDEGVMCIVPSETSKKECNLTDVNEDGYCRVRSVRVQ